MEQQIRDRYHQSILKEAQRRYGIADDQIKALDAFESFIFEFTRADGAYILRLSHNLRRSVDLIQGEVDWINYLADNGVSVARAILSEDGELVEAIDDTQGGYFLATAFIKAEGQRAWDVPFTTAFYETYGELLGKMHALAQTYTLANPAWRRPEWNDAGLDFPTMYLPASEGLALGKYRDLVAYLNGLPKDTTSYGLIHLDAHPSNLFITDSGKLTLFDFDEASYSWFINDIAIVLFYVVMDAKDWPAYTREFMIPFLRGYQRTNTLDPSWLKEIPHFLKLRELELYAVMYRDFDVEAIDDEWCARFMKGRKARIDSDVPFIDFDFETLAKAL